MPKKGTTGLKTQLLVNEMVIPLNDFTQQYIGNVLKGIAQSLGCSGKDVRFNLDRDGLNFYSEDKDIEIKTEFSRDIVESTVKGMLSPIRGIVWIEKVMITTKG
ncbi:MAG: hypothetical protein JSV13_10940 [Nitrospiraceae bacterium]|nr:MAG: hypothetical protein JSV13_10940 [Nitrospiraceae bacterium]